MITFIGSSFIWGSIPIGRGSGLKIRTIWVRIPFALPFLLLLEIHFSFSSWTAYGVVKTVEGAVVSTAGQLTISFEVF